MSYNPGGSGVTTFNTRSGAVTLSGADVATVLAALTSTGGIDFTDSGTTGFQVNESGAGGIALTDNSANGINLVENSSGGGISITDGGTFGIILEETGNSTVKFVSQHYGVQFVAPSNGFTLYTANINTNLPTPANPPSFGFTEAGHIYFFASPSGPWTLVA